MSFSIDELFCLVALLANPCSFSDSFDVTCFGTSLFILDCFGQICGTCFVFCCAQDNPSIEDMAHFVKADVTICTRSTFCTSVSVLNPKCVLVPNMHSRIRGLNRFLYDTDQGCLSEYMFYISYSKTYC